MTRFQNLSVITLLMAVTTGISEPQAQLPGLFEGRSDVGNVRVHGSVDYDGMAQEYVLSGAGTNMWFDQDEFFFVWRRLKGPFILRTRLDWVGQGVEPHRKAGLIVRSSRSADSAYVDAALHGDGLTALQYRRSQAAQTEEARLQIEGADVLQLERKGDRYTVSAALWGEPFERQEVSGIDLGDEVYVGLFVCSHNPELSEKAVFTNVRLVIPPADDFVPYRDYIGSNLEVLDVESGRRTIVHRTEDSMQAPNWTLDGRSLIYNRNGRLYRFDLQSSTAGLLETGFAASNNNDHVLSFDGTMLGISHHSPEDGNASIIYTLSSEGGTPKRVTPLGPSYLHGWSPDGKTLVYTGIRDGEADIYAISTQGGQEVRLTSTKGLDDGSEYSPDGGYIYFNSARTGSMQIWRMKPDGSDPEQLTDDGFHNWFPHLSPDGRRVAFLSYSSEVDAEDHPFYKQVYLRLMSSEGGEARVIAYVYGGQGTINVPSWSPDGKRLAFVSNTDLH